LVERRFAGDARDEASAKSAIGLIAPTPGDARFCRETAQLYVYPIEFANPPHGSQAAEAVADQAFWLDDLFDTTITRSLPSSR